MDVSENDRPAIVKSLTLEEHNSLSQSNSQFEKKKMEVHDESSGDSYDEKLNVFVSASTEVHEEAVREDLNNSKDDRCETGTAEENMNATEIKSEPLSPSVKVKEEPVNENDNEETETDEDERDRLAADQESSVLRHILGNQPVDSEPTNVPHPVFMVRSEELKNTIKKEPGSVEDVPQSSNGLSESIYLRIPIQGLKAPWASSKESLRSSKNFEESRKRRKSPWRKPLERASCLVCNAPCIITVNRKILSLPFCKRCKKSYFYQMSARLHKGGACGRTECSLQGNCTIDYRLKKRCPACLRQKFDLILKQGQSHFKERLGPFDPFSEENINRYRWGKTQTVRSTLSKEASTKEYPKSLTKSAISSRMRRRRHKEAKLMAEALTNVPRVVLRRCDEIQSSSGVYGTNDNSKSPVTVHRTSHDLSSSKMFLKPSESLPRENGYKTVVKGEPANPVEEEFVGVQKEEPVEEIVDEPVNLVKQEQDSDHLVVEENPGEAILNHDTGIRSERKSPCHVPPAPQMAPATSGEFANLHSKILKYGTILSQLQTFTNSPSEMETDTRPKAAGTIMFDTNHIQPPTAIYQAKSTEESKNLLSHVKNKLSERLNFMTSTKIMKGVPKRSKTIKVCVFSCGHACNTCNSPSSTKWLQSTGYQCADPLQQSASKKQLGRPSGPVADRSSEEPGIVLDLNIINKLIQQRNLVIDHASGTVCLPKSLQKSNKVTYNMKAPETVSFVNYSGVIDLTKNHEQVSQPKPDPVVNPASLIIPAPPIYYSQAPNSTPRQTLVPSQVAQTGSQGNNLTWAVTPVTPGPSSNSLCNQLLSRGTVINVPQSVIQANANVPQLQPFALSGGLNSTIPQSVVRVNPDGSMVIPLSYNSFNKPTQLNIPVAPPVTSIPLGTSAPCSSNYIYMPKTGLIEPTVKKGLQNKKIKKSN